VITNLFHNPKVRGSHACLWISQNQATLKEDTGFIDRLGNSLMPKDADAVEGSVHYDGRQKAAAASPQLAGK
jgi:hypothetical protein